MFRHYHVIIVIFVVCWWWPTRVGVSTLVTCTARTLPFRPHQFTINTISRQRLAVCVFMYVWAVSAYFRSISYCQALASIETFNLDRWKTHFFCYTKPSNGLYIVSLLHVNEPCINVPNWQLCASYMDCKYATSERANV